MHRGSYTVTILTFIHLKKITCYFYLDVFSLRRFLSKAAILTMLVTVNPGKHHLLSVGELLPHYVWCLLENRMEHLTEPAPVRQDYQDQNISTRRRINSTFECDRFSFITIMSNVDDLLRRVVLGNDITCIHSAIQKSWEIHTFTFRFYTLTSLRKNSPSQPLHCLDRGKNKERRSEYYE